MRRLFFRAAAVALCVTVGFGVAATPSLAADAAKTPGAKAPTSLTRLSPASRQVLAKSTPTTRRTEGGQQTPATTSSGGPFFSSKKGMVTLALMGAGVGLTIWSINHDRKPVKSPVR